MEFVSNDGKTMFLQLLAGLQVHNLAASAGRRSTIFASDTRPD